MLPGKDGFSVMSELRQAGQFVPTLMLTARGHPDDVLRGFRGRRGRLPHQAVRTLDPDRAHPRPAAPPRVAARFAEQRSAASATDSFHSATSRCTSTLLELRVRDQVFPLTLMEANVLRYLIQHEGKPVSRKTMLEEVWGLHEDTDTRAIDNFIVRLRRYIEDDPTQPRHLLTVRGVGYRFVGEVPDLPDAVK